MADFFPPLIASVGIIPDKLNPIPVKKDADVHRKFILRCDTQIRELEMASKALHSPGLKFE